MSLSVQRKALNYGLLLTVGFILLGAYALLLGFLPEMNLVKEFDLSYVAAAQVFAWLDVISWGVSLVALIGALGTGGASLIAAAGTMGVKKYLKDMVEEKGKQAAISY
ncbi:MULTISPECIES: uberolysin/carnocyclin family circular bacteriocin [Bacillus]|uniref:Circularin A/uberolysin family circular bacteriocin n=2 Tax=Bacillus TaxID=1386 RepID=A0A0M4FLZ6_9BACI|nr:MULTISPECIES: uberolysin/carnocyclin family circular bacteriocin [Bacillus]ALC83217.1 circularin A/uberolysin family circular bacteriocin [Bacillus gobiensis]MBP1084215.1 circularin A/uberolysin family circular bacteriocin [Bacillus capparidis]MED1094669.1 uberolysin/carnocyclin family circular bacteriocin [Bacillus capparidis]